MENNCKPVLVNFSYRPSMVFESITDVLEYFSSIGHPLPNAKAVVRRIDNNENWTYTDVINDGENRITRVTEVRFDWATDKPVSEDDPDAEWRPRLK